MMSVKEYAQDINKTIEEVLAKCKELNIDVNSTEDILEEDHVIDLDNAFNNMFTEEKEEGTEDIIDDEKIEEIISKVNIDVDDTVKKQKLKKRVDNKNNDFFVKRKEMYKNKEKLTANIPTAQENIILYKEGMTVNELANTLEVRAAELIKKLIDLGIMSNINSVISFDDAELLVVDYNKELKRAETQDEANFEKLEITDDEKDLECRPPVVTIMGHVDHGKTTLLDKIRETNVVGSEFGGITQHIGAYQITYHDQKITFIDTPGHEAFTEMRARGASITDIVLIIVAADDGVMPQTKEAIDHAKAAKVPIIVVINKIDKKEADPDKIMTQMTENGLTPEEWGGNTIFTKVSATTGVGIPELLENILLVTELEELKANLNRYALGTVIEAKLNKNVGPVVTLLVQNGTLRLGDPIVVGTVYGKVRTMKNDINADILEAVPSMPVEITGLTAIPAAGDKFMAFETEKQAKSIAATRKEKAKRKETIANDNVSLEDLFAKISAGYKEINVIIKTDVKGSEEALCKALEQMQVDDIKINIIRSGTGTITESDIVLANASDAIIIGFNVRPNAKTMEIGKEYNVDIRLYNVIYKVIEELEAAMKGMLEPIYEEKVLGQAEVRKLFKFSKTGTIAGCYVVDGIIKMDAKARVVRDGIVIYDGNINSVQREKDSVKEVKKGIECGITIENYNDIKEQDVIEAYEIIEIKKG